MSNNETITHEIVHEHIHPDIRNGEVHAVNIRCHCGGCKHVVTHGFWKGIPNDYRSDDIHDVTWVYQPLPDTPVYCTPCGAARFVPGHPGCNH